MALCEKLMTIYPELTDADFNPSAGGCIELRDDSDGKGPYIFSWNHPTLSQPTIEQIDAAQPVPPVKALVVVAVQRRLDGFAVTGGFDSIFTACTYAGSKNPARRAQGAYAVDIRDAHWDKCQEILIAVETGARPLPTVDEVLALMPPLAWPA